MIIVKHHTINNVPFLEVVQAEHAEKSIPLVFFYHGWTSQKESVLVHGYELAKQGIRALLPDALYHGERQVGPSVEHHYAEFWDIVIQNIEEFPMLVDYFVTKGLADWEHVGVTGLSMGGITTCGLFASEPRIKAASCLMGAPNYSEFMDMLVSEGQKRLNFTFPEAMVATMKQKLEPYDLGRAPEKIAGRPFHLWHGRQDGVVPFQPTYHFYNTHKNEEYGRRMRFTATDDEHKVPYTITLEMSRFFREQMF